MTTLSIERSWTQHGRHACWGHRRAWCPWKVISTEVLNPDTFIFSWAKIPLPAVVQLSKGKLPKVCFVWDPRTFSRSNLGNRESSQFLPPSPKRIGGQKWEVRHHPWFKGNHVNESSCPLKVLDCNPFSASTMKNYGKCLSVSTKTCSPGSFPVPGPHPQAQWEPAGPMPVASLHFTISANACRLPPHPSSLCWLSFHPTDPSAEWLSC